MMKGYMESVESKKQTLSTKDSKLESSKNTSSQSLVNMNLGKILHSIAPFLKQ